MNRFLIEAVGAAAACLTTFCWVPQALRTIRLRDTRAISLPAQLAFAAGLSLWLVYGLLIVSWPLMRHREQASHAQHPAMRPPHVHPADQLPR